MEITRIGHSFLPVQGRHKIQSDLISKKRKFDFFQRVVMVKYRNPAESKFIKNNITTDKFNASSPSPNEISFNMKTAGVSANKKWHKMYEALIQFKGIHGHCLVPNRYIENPQLGSWVSTQRRQYKLMKQNQLPPMTPARVELLESIGFAWATRDPRHVPWEIRFEQLKEYRVENGSCLVPIGHKKNPQLSNWVSTQRQEYKLLMMGRKSRITHERIKTLNDIGFVWEAHRGGKKTKKRRKDQVSPFESNEPDSNQVVPSDVVSQEQCLMPYSVQSSVPISSYPLYPPRSMYVPQLHSPNPCPNENRSTESSHDTYYTNNYKSTYNGVSFKMGSPFFQFNLSTRIHSSPHFEQRRYQDHFRDYPVKNRPKFNRNSQRFHSPDPVISSDANMSKCYHTPKTQFTTITPDASTLDKIWKEQHMHLVQFKETYGHCNVPHNYELDPYLRHWVFIQKEQCQLWKQGKQSTMTFPRYEALNKLRLEWKNTSELSNEPNLIFSTPQGRGFIQQKEVRQETDPREVTPCPLVPQHDETPKASQFPSNPNPNPNSNDSEDVHNSSIQAALALYSLSSVTVPSKASSEDTSIMNIMNKQRYF